VHTVSWPFWYCHLQGVCVTTNRFLIGGLDLLVLRYNYTQLQPLITAHNQWLLKARSVSFCDWLVNFLAADQFTLSLTSSLSDVSLICLENCFPFIMFRELYTEHLIQWFLFHISVVTVYVCVVTGTCLPALTHGNPCKWFIVMKTCLTKPLACSGHLLWLHYHSFQASCHIAPSLSLLRTLFLLSDVSACDVLFLWLGSSILFFSVVTSFHPLPVLPP
jgi:hypothetical protein